MQQVMAMEMTLATCADRTSAQAPTMRTDRPGCWSVGKDLTGKEQISSGYSTGLQRAMCCCSPSPAHLTRFLLSLGALSMKC